MKNKKSFENPSNKPVDVEYRLRRAQQSIEEALIFIRAIDPNVFPEGFHSDTVRAAETLSAYIAQSQISAPKKRPRKTKSSESEEQHALAAE